MANVNADDAALVMKLPSLMLQPILENAIKFGLYDTVGDVVIILEARAEGKLPLVVEIKNPFDPTSSVLKTGTGFWTELLFSEDFPCFFIEMTF